MTDHVCEWGFVVPYYKGAEKVFIICKDNKCKMVLTKKQGAAMLDAAQVFSAEDAKVLDDLMPTSIPAYLVPAWQKAVDALSAYTKARVKVEDGEKNGDG